MTGRCFCHQQDPRTCHRAPAEDVMPAILPRPSSVCRISGQAMSEGKTDQLTRRWKAGVPTTIGPKALVSNPLQANSLTRITLKGITGPESNRPDQGGLSISIGGGSNGLTNLWLGARASRPQADQRPALPRAINPLSPPPVISRPSAFSCTKSQQISGHSDQ